uniref:Uncharacterized protein n=1 Tax=Spongospora subterranea TaxID=70186 RepID=A0A0H5QU73_9EUKA|eukprot:CRZ05445.1 hypothetical protein [Spongospora subterranea]
MLDDVGNVDIFHDCREIAASFPEDLQNLLANDTYSAQVSHFVEHSYSAALERADTPMQRAAIVKSGHDYAREALEAISSHILNCASRLNDFLDVQEIAVDDLNQQVNLMQLRMKMAREMHGGQIHLAAERPKQKIGKLRVRHAEDDVTPGRYDRWRLDLSAFDNSVQTSISVPVTPTSSSESLSQPSSELVPPGAPPCVAPSMPGPPPPIAISSIRQKPRNQNPMGAGNRKASRTNFMEIPPFDGSTSNEPAKRNSISVATPVFGGSSSIPRPPPPPPPPVPIASKSGSYAIKGSPPVAPPPPPRSASNRPSASAVVPPPLPPHLASYNSRSSNEIAAPKLAPNVNRTNERH